MTTSATTIDNRHTNNIEEEAMTITADNLTDVRNLVRAIDNMGRTNDNHIFPVEFRRLLGRIHFFTINFDEHKNGRLLQVESVKVGKGGLIAYVNCKQLSIPFSIREHEDDVYLPSLAGRTIERSEDKRLSTHGYSSLNFLRTSVRDIAPLFEDESLALDFVDKVAQLDSMTEWLRGANVVLFSDECNAVVALSGSRRWVFPTVMDLVDPSELHVYTGTFKRVNGKNVAIPGPTLAEALGMDVVQEKQEDETPSQSSFETLFTDEDF